MGRKSKVCRERWEEEGTKRREDRNLGMCDGRNIEERNEEVRKRK